MFYANEAKAIETFAGASGPLVLRLRTVSGERDGLSGGKRAYYLRPMPLSFNRYYMSVVGDIEFRVPK